MSWYLCIRINWVVKGESRDTTNLNHIVDIAPLIPMSWQSVRVSPVASNYKFVHVPEHQ